MSLSRGIHIVFEGPDAVGKSTQIKRAGQWLESQGYSVVLTREPGDTALGIELRKLLLDSDLGIDPRAEALLMAADRAQNVSEIVTPNIEKGNVVISDRHIPSSLVYQGVVRGLGVQTIAELSAFAVGDHTADLVLCLDIDDDIARARAKGEPDRIEREGEDFHQGVRNAYRELTNQFGWTRVDAMGSEEEVAARIADLITPLLVNQAS